LISVAAEPLVDVVAPGQIDLLLMHDLKLLTEVVHKPAQGVVEER